MGSLCLNMKCRLYMPKLPLCPLCWHLPRYQAGHTSKIVTVPFLPSLIVCSSLHPHSSSVRPQCWSYVPYFHQTSFYHLWPGRRQVLITQYGGKMNLEIRFKVLLIQEIADKLLFYKRLMWHYHWILPGWSATGTKQLWVFFYSDWTDYRQ